MFLKLVQWRAQMFCWNEKAVSDVLCKNKFLADLLENQYLFEISQTSFTVKKSENMAKSGCFKKCLRWRAPMFFKMKQG